jgi:murein DD-endopeptidase MepM/ murein hydrolase activator NlpD
MEYVDNKTIMLIVALLMSVTTLNSTNHTAEFNRYGSYSNVTFGKSVTSSIPIYSPIPLSALKKDLSKCSNIGFRHHPIFKVTKAHNGIDLPANKGTDVIATCNGIIKFAGTKLDGYGNQIVIVSGEYSIRYAHLSEIFVESLDSLGNFNTVNFGDKIGEVGSTGSSTGNHLHYEIYKSGFLQDPIPYIQANEEIFKK